jgi:transposase
LVHNKLTGEYFLCVPREVSIVDSENQVMETTRPVTSIDPGVRTFATVYDPEDEHVLFFGNYDHTVLLDIAIKADKLISI